MLCRVALQRPGEGGGTELSYHSPLDVTVEADGVHLLQQDLDMSADVSISDPVRLLGAHALAGQQACCAVYASSSANSVAMLTGKVRAESEAGLRCPAGQVPQIVHCQ